MSDFGWIPVTKRKPKDLEEVIITCVIENVERYDGDTEDIKFSGAAVFYDDNWYWYSNATLHVLMTHGEYKDMLIDDAIKITAWMPFPEPYKEESDEQKGYY